MDTIDRLPRTATRHLPEAAAQGQLIEHKQYIDKHGEDMRNPQLEVESGPNVVRESTERGGKRMRIGIAADMAV